MDRQRIPRISALQDRARRRWRVKRQVHERPDDASRRRARHLARSHSADLPQLLPARESLDVRRRAAGGGRLMSSLEEDARLGLTCTPKDIPPKWFYDDRGSALFEEITRLDEYYPTRREREILVERAPEIGARAGADTLVELGSGR